MGLQRIETKTGHYYKLDGRRVTGVTTLINGGLPKPKLVDWAAREVAEYVADNWADVESHRDAGREQLVDHLKTRHQKARDTAAVRGTSIHAYAEQLIAGEEVEAPAELVGYIESCARFLDDWRIQPVIVERPLASRTWWYSGTPDVIGDVPDGRRLITDWKTGRSGIWGETALQLAAYAKAEFYLDDDNIERPIPHVDAGLAVWLRPDGYDTYLVEDLDGAFQVFKHVAHVARAARSLKDTFISPALDTPTWTKETPAA
ncbi:hypothetical protein [Streptomyces axinellae]|uniref:PD-(D/E)XK nuclease family protein n=1 Tax=Streptomyces axinellae TaxID=552788 RepID=A0ABP6CZA3_9ACTN